MRGGNLSKMQHHHSGGGSHSMHVAVRSLSDVDMSALEPLPTSNKVGREFASLRPLSPAAQDLRILLLEPLFPPQAAWGSAKTEQGYLPPIGTISVYSWLKYRGYQADFVDTQFGDFTPERLQALLAEKGYDIVAMPVFTPTAD